MAKITQIYTLIDEASAELDNIAAAHRRVAAEVDKNAQANKVLAQSERQVNDATTRTAETLRVVSAARTIETKQINAAENAYKRLMGRYDEATRMANATAAAEKILQRARDRGIITMEQYRANLATVTHGIENNVMATGRAAASQLSFGKILERSQYILKTYLAAMALRGVYAFTTGVVDATLSIEKMTATMTAVTGSISAARAGMEFAKQTAHDLGLEYRVVGEQYAKFLASSRGTELQDQAQSIFTGFSKAGVALRMSAADMDGVFRALTQMISKGTVQAEELRGQLGERLPGALKLAADSMGMTTAALGKMMKDGELTAEDLLPRLSAALEALYGPEAARAADSMQGSVNNLKNAFFELMTAMGEGALGGLWKGLMDTGTAALTWITEGYKAMGYAIDRIQVATGMSIRILDNLGNASLGQVILEIERVQAAIAQLNEEGDGRYVTENAKAVRKVQQDAYAAYIKELESRKAVLEVVGNAEESTSLKQEKAANAMGKLADELNPLYKATQTYNQALAVLDNQMMTNDITQEQYELTLAQIDAQYGKTAASALGLKAAQAAENKAAKALAVQKLKDQKEFQKEWDKIVKQDEAQKKVDVSLDRETAIHEARQQGVRDLTDLTNAMDLAATKEAAIVSARKLNFIKGSAEEERYLTTTMQAKALEQENAKLEQVQKSYEALATDAEKYKFELEDILKLHKNGSPAAIRAIELLDEKYAHLLPTIHQVKLAMVEGFKDVSRESTNVFDDVRKAVSTAMTGIETAILDMVHTGKTNFRDLANSILDDLLRIAIQSAIVGPISNAFGSALGSAIGVGAGSATGGTYYGTSGSSGNLTLGGTSGSSLVAFRSGGVFDVPGVGGPDSKVVGFRASPGERVTIEPVNKSPLPSSSSGVGGVTVQIVNNGAPATAEVSAQRQPDGDLMIRVLMQEVAKDIVNNGPVAQAIDRTRGTRVRGAVR